MATAVELSCKLTTSAGLTLQQNAVTGNVVGVQVSFGQARKTFALRGKSSVFKVQKMSVVVSALEDDIISTAEKVTGVDEEVDIYPSGEWPANFSMSNYEDLSHHYAPSLFKKEAQPDTILPDIMSKVIWTAQADTTLAEVSHHFEDVTGLPVIDKDQKVIGVVSKKDLKKSPNGLEGKAGDVMTSPAVTITADKTVRDAAVLMLKNKVHRIPVVNESEQLVGIVTRTDIFTALDGLPSKG